MRGVVDAHLADGRIGRELLEGEDAVAAVAYVQDATTQTAVSKSLAPVDCVLRCVPNGSLYKQPMAMLLQFPSAVSGNVAGIRNAADCNLPSLIFPRMIVGT